MKYLRFMLSGLLLALLATVFGGGMVVGVALNTELRAGMPPKPTSTPTPQTCYEDVITPAQIVDLTNAERAKAGLPALTHNDQLDVAAMSKASDMKLRHYWAHTSPIGTPPWAWITAAGYTYVTAGENLAEEFSSSAGVMTGWMNSPEHRDNILNAGFTDIGVGVGCGTFSGTPATVVVAEYGSR